MVKKSCLFLDTIQNKIDTKLRISVPGSFRAVLEEMNTELILYASFKQPCLEGLTGDMLEVLAQGIYEQYDMFSEEENDLTSLIFAESRVFPLDSTGRLTLPPKLMEHAELSDTALFVGKGKTFQIWNPEIFAEEQQRIREKMKTRPLTFRLKKEANE